MIRNRCEPSLYLPEALNTAAVHTHYGALTSIKSHLFLSGVLSHCVPLLTLDSRKLRGNLGAAATLAQLLRYCALEMIVYGYGK